MQKKIIPILMSIALMLSGLFAVSTIYNMQGNARVINYTGVVRGATQKLVKQELMHVQDDELIDRLDGIILELITGEGENGLSRLKDRKFQECMSRLSEKWTELKQGIAAVREGSDSAGLYLLSEEYFELADEAVVAAEEYSEQTVGQAATILVILTLVFITGAAILAVYLSVQSKRRSELEKAEDENRRKSEYLSIMAGQLQAPMNEISEVLYVADVENYELLFLNEAGQKQFGAYSFVGKKCYNVLQNQDGPCPFCTNKYLKEGEIYSWEFTNYINGRHYMLKDRLIEWDGRKARMEMAFDTTEAEIEKQQLKYRLNAEQMIMECVRTLYKERDIEKGIGSVLERLGSFLQADRAYVLMVRDALLYNDYEWCEKGVSPQKDILQEIPESTMERWVTEFEQKGFLIIEDVEQLKDRSPTEYFILEEQGITSLVAAPLERDGNLEGFVGVDNPPLDRVENIAVLLQTLCYFLMLAYWRAENEEQLSVLSYHDKLTSFYNRNRYIEDVDKLSTQDQPAGIVYLDVNGLKDINDKHGHAFGDKILTECANRMKIFFEGSDFYRIGGDEFVIISQIMTRQDFELKVGELRQSFQGDDLLHAAIGAEWADQVKDIQQIIANADARMYEDKKEFYRNHKASKRYRHHSDEALHLEDQEILQNEIDQGHFF